MLHDRKYLAVADEEGYVSILDTTTPTPQEIHDGWPPAQWLAHQNAIFDIAWCKVSSLLPTVSCSIEDLDTGHVLTMQSWKSHRPAGST